VFSPPFPPGDNNDTCSGGPGTNVVQNCEITSWRWRPARWWRADTHIDTTEPRHCCAEADHRRTPL